MGLLVSEMTPLDDDALNKILVQIGTHCKRLEHLHIFNAGLGEAKASMIVKMLPKLKDLVAGYCSVERDSVVTLLRGCKELEMVDFYRFDGFEQGDEEFLKLASNITFSCGDQSGLQNLNLFRTYICLSLGNAKLLNLRNR